MNRITTKITSVVIAATLLALTGCTGSIPEGQSFREDKTATTEIDGCKIRKFYIKTSYSDMNGEPVFMVRGAVKKYINEPRPLFADNSRMKETA